MIHYLQFHIKGDDEDGGERAASREPGQLKTGGEAFPNRPSLPSRSGETGGCLMGVLRRTFINAPELIVFRDAA